MLDSYRIFFIFSSILAIDGRNVSINTENALIGDLRGQIISTTHLLEDATYRIEKNPALMDIMAAPIRSMLYKLTPRVGNDMIKGLLASTGECADSKVKLHLIDFDSIVREQTEIYKSIFDACEAYLDQYEGPAVFNLSSRGTSKSDESVYRGVKMSYDYIAASYLNYQRGGNGVMKTFLDNFDTLSDLSKSTFHGLFQRILSNSYRTLDLTEAAGAGWKRIIERTKSGPLKQTVVACLRSMGGHMNNVVSYTKRATKRYIDGEAELAAKVTKLTKESATANADDAKTINAEIGKAKDKMEKYIAIRSLVSSYQYYASVASDNLRAPIVHLFEE